MSAVLTDAIRAGWKRGSTGSKAGSVRVAQASSGLGSRGQGGGGVKGGDRGMSVARKEVGSRVPGYQAFTACMLLLLKPQSTAYIFGQT